jgi:adenosylmethionine-8-amino-7-oxononanoate aminotransferase
VLLVSDEVICAFGRLGTTSACEKFDHVPDIITCAKGLTSGYSPIAAMIAADRLMEPFLRTKETFDAEESERLLRGFLSPALLGAGLCCRADDRGDPVIQLAPPLGCDQTNFDEIEQVLRSVLTTAWTTS